MSIVTMRDVNNVNKIKLGVQKKIIEKIDNSNKRILTIWDFRTVPFSIGDIITLLERLEIESEIHNINLIDVALVYEKENPARQYKFNGSGKLESSTGSQGITKKNFHINLIPLISTFYISNHIGSFHIFDDYDKLYQFANNENYILIPAIDKIESQYHAYRDNFNFITEYFKQNKRIPYLSCRQGTIETINNFLFGLKKYPIVCHVRNTESMNSRNSNKEEWFKFFESYENNKDIIFILIGTKNDTKYFKQLKNILISKDFFNTVEEDMILIRQSLLFLGTRSGPLMMPIFSGTPCIIFDYLTAPHEIVDAGKNFNFMNEYQRLIFLDRNNQNKKATKDDIKKEFELLFNSLDKNNWLEKIKKNMYNNKSSLELI